MKQKFDIITSTCVPLPLENVDTDQIIPARFLKATTREERFFGDNLFRDWRYRADGSVVEDFVLNDPKYTGCILVAGKNFGSGSSREHAAWAIAGYGFRVVISSFFADIHKNNELNNFVLPVQVSDSFLSELFLTIQNDPKTQVMVDLPNQTVTNLATGHSEQFEINGYKKHCLMNGLDDIDFLVANKDKITTWECNATLRPSGQRTAEQVNTYQRIPPFVEIMDSTLRDGEQTNGVSFLPHEKVVMARKLLYDLNVDRIEVASARVSEGECEAVTKICRYARQIARLDRVEVLGFVDGGQSVDWIYDCGGRVMNLLAKGSLKHCTQQLHKTPEEHISDIRKELEYAASKGISVNLYLEDWSNGMKDSPEYVYQLMDSLTSHLSPHTSIKRFMLPDTLGVMNPLQVIEYFRKMMKRYPHVHFDFHAHNDYDLAVSNSLAAVLSGARGLHVTVNGLGERCGNAPLASVQAILKDQFHAKTNIVESQLNDISRMVESFSGISVAPNQPIVGENVFTQVAGVHADGDTKDKLYYNELIPERFGRKREYALGKNSGRANIAKNLEELGLELTPEQTRRVTERITELGDKKEIVTQEDLPYIVSDVLKHDGSDDKVKLISYVVSTAYGLKPGANIKVEINGRQYEGSALGDGQYDAFVKALRHIYKKYLDRTFPILTNYQVSIPPGGRTDALVQTLISWHYKDGLLRTRGLDADQTESAIKATFKMLNIIENELSE
ncbi:MAG: 3-isopropylmalate dehydratase small subunit [Prevotella sp.]|jgi:D-citramalate synthase|nr:3-isopropylmalate dehydratase small subunit [Prevotella sp.]